MKKEMNAPTWADCKTALKKLSRSRHGGSMILWQDGSNVSALRRLAMANPDKSLDALAEENIAGWEIL
jgi:hypothetical protein